MLKKRLFHLPLASLHLKDSRNAKVSARSKRAFCLTQEQDSGNIMINYKGALVYHNLIGNYQHSGTTETSLDLVFHTLSL